MKNIVLIAASVFFFSLTCLATDVVLYDWEKDRKATSLPAKELAMEELIIKQHHQFDYTFENDQFVMYWAFHRIIYVNNNEAIRKNNRISIPIGRDEDLVELKARVLNKNGKVVNFDKSNLKELKDEESGKGSRLFAIDGIETGAEVEYFYIRKMSGLIYQRIFLQSDIQVNKSSLLLTSPGHLKFDFKAYNVAAEIVKEESKDSKERNQYKISGSNITGLKNESYSYFQANLGRVEFKLAYNTARSGARIYTWEEAAKTFYKLLYALEKDEEKAVDKIVKSCGDKASLPVAERIVNVEDKIKNDIKIDESLRGSSLVDIQKYKIASNEGMAKLLIAVYNKLGIRCHPVITCDREKVRFDGDFDTWSYLDDYVIYFPDVDGFLAPYDQTTRYPLIPAELTEQQALFIEPISIGAVQSALATIKKIPAVDYKLSCDNLDIEVSFTDDIQANRIKMNREFAGYDGRFVVPYFNLMTQDQKKNMVDEIIKQTAPDAKISVWDAKVVKSAKNSSCVLDLDFQSSHFLERAGPRILFKAGLLIGPQVEMYRDDERMNAIENDFNRGYEREIRIVIPNGYTIKNLNDIKMKVVFDGNENTPFIFESNYTLKDNLLTITIQEYYKELRVPLERYENFRKVINAAADFNKLTLVLEKQK